MKQFSSMLLLASACLSLHRTVLARDSVEVKWNPAVREYCHLLQFPLGWQMPKFVPKGDGTLEVYGSISLEGADYEFRVPGVLSTRFLVRVVDVSQGQKKYTTNLYEVDLADPTAVPKTASEQAWNSAAVVPLRAYGFPGKAFVDAVKAKGFHFDGSGDHKRGIGSVSPDQSVAVVQSWSGTLGPSAGSDVPGDFSIHFPFGNAHGKLFFDAYNADTGKKLVTIVAKFVGIFPEDEVFGRTGWVTERYFFIPLDQHREKCLICDFGRKAR